MISKTPSPPYFAVIFTSLRTEGDQGYSAMAQRMEEFAREQPGFLGMESARDGLGITVSYWDNLESIRTWKQQTDHLMAQKLGKEQWYSDYKIRICRVERDYGKE